MLMTRLASTSSGTPLALRRLIALRWVLLAGELAAILLAPSVLDVPMLCVVINAPVKSSVVNPPAAGVVVPIAGGDAK